LPRGRVADEIEIVVRDEGRGIAPEILPEIFRPHVSTRGSGLGLHIVETIVKQDGGKVSAPNGGDGRGAEFTITLPGLIEQKQSKRAASAVMTLI
jgi:signal transduction histidine kinase